MTEPTPPPAPTIRVLILNWNGRAYLEACLNALRAQTYAPESVILLDNGSTDDSIAFVRDRFPEVVVRANGGNLGFAAGNNVALDALAADAALLLNPDVVLSPGCLAALAAALAADPTIGMAGCKLWYPGGTILQHAGGFITHPQALPGHYGIGEPDTGQHDTPRDVEYLIGGALAVRRAALEQVGLLDEGFFLFFEDVDLCARVRAAGWRVIYAPQATGVHVESATTGKGSFAYLQRFHTGRWRYLLKHFPAEEITGATLSAEMAWLDQIGAAERRAVTLAYVATRRNLGDIWGARRREGAGPLSPETQRAVEAALGQLADRARRAGFEATGLAALRAKAELRVQPFTSTVPLIGPLIVRLRTAWNDVASRWYLDHLMFQQNEFNRLAVQQIEAYEVELREQLELLEEQIVAVAEGQRRAQELEAQLADLERELTAGNKSAKRSNSQDALSVSKR